MVLSERNSELVRNGRRSRGPSPNGHNNNTIMNHSNNTNSAANAPSVMSNSVGGGGTPDTSSDDDNSMKQKNGIRNKNSKSEYEEKIRVGRDYQAVCPPFATESERSKLEGTADRALLVWKPTKDIPDNKLEEYISVAKEKYGYNGEQALGMLFWHKHDLERAVMDLANFTPFPDEWTVEDKVLFEQAFQFHGKSFHRIRQMLPDKSIASLVKYYYSWKKTRHRQSTMDRQEKSKGSKEGSENGSENGSNEDSDNDDKDQSAGILDSNKSNKSQNNNYDNNAAAGVFDYETGDNSMANSENSIGICVGACSGRTNCQGCDSGYCSNCGVYCNVLFQSPHGKLCDSCHHHWRRTGERRPISCPYKRMRSDRCLDKKNKRRPRGIHINHDDIITLATQNYGSHDNLMVSLEREIDKGHTKIQLNKALISDQKKRLTECSEELRPSEPVSRINARWSNDECLLAVQGVRRYGKDFQTIAEIIGTKTEAHVRTFYVNHRRRYNLDQLLKTHESDKQAAAAAANAAASATATNEKSADDKTNATSSSCVIVDLDADVDGAATAVTKSITKTTSAITNNSTDIEMSEKKEESMETNTIEESLADKNQIDMLMEKKDINNIDGIMSTSSSTVSNKNAANLDSNDAPKQIVEIDLDVEQLADPPTKKLAIAAANHNFPESKAAGS